MQLCLHQNDEHMTTGKRYMDRTNGKGREAERLIDARTKSILQRIQKEPKGRALDAYLRIMAS